MRRPSGAERLVGFSMEHKPKILIIDGQGGRLGGLLMAELRRVCPEAELFAVGTNSIATSAMLKAGADQGATGENAILVACRKADIIVGPIGILSADSLLGEISPAIAVAVGQSEAKKLLLPVNQCSNIVVGVRDMTLSQLMDEAVATLRSLLG